MGLAPSHPVDHTPKLILSFDSAWDHEKLAAEKLIDSHRWTRYIRGETRGDLDPVRDYLKSDQTPDQEPVVLSFRRMTRPQWNLYADRADKRADGTRREGQARELAISWCLLEVDGTKIKFNRAGTEDGPLDDGDLDSLRELVSDDGMFEIGRMAVQCSRSLLASEGKPSGSGPGPGA